MRRIAALAAATLRDRFAGRTLLLAAALLAAWFLAERDLRAATPDEAAALRLERRLTLVGWVAAGAALLAGAHAIGSDRRTQQVESWRAAPVTMGEVVVGRWLGACAGVAAGAAPLFLWVAALAPDSLVRQGESFAPRPQQPPTRVARTLADGQVQAWRRGALLLDAGERVALDFDAVAEGPRELVVPWRAALAEGERRPARFALSVDGDEKLVVRGGDLARVALALAPRSAHRVELSVAADSGVVRVELPEVALRGAPRSLLPTLLRLAAGFAVEIALAAALGAALAALLHDALATLGGALLLLLCNLRALFVEVAVAVHDHEGGRHADEALESFARAFERVVVALPDLSRLRGVARATRAELPWAGECGPFAVALLWIAGALLLGTVALARRPRGCR